MEGRVRFSSLGRWSCRIPVGRCIRSRSPPGKSLSVVRWHSRARRTEMIKSKFWDRGDFAPFPSSVVVFFKTTVPLPEFIGEAEPLMEGWGEREKGTPDLGCR